MVKELEYASEYPLETGYKEVDGELKMMEVHETVATDTTAAPAPASQPVSEPTHTTAVVEEATATVEPVKQETVVPQVETTVAPVVMAVGGGGAPIMTLDGSPATGAAPGSEEPQEEKNWKVWAGVVAVILAIVGFVFYQKLK